MVITSSDNKKIKEIKKLNDRKYRDKEGLFLIEGQHLVSEAYKHGLLVELFLEEGQYSEFDIKTTYFTKDIMKELSSLTTPSVVIGICKKKVKPTTLGDRILLLDNIQDPGNLGTIIRSAVAFNIDTVILGTGTVDVYNAKVLRATQGLIFHINIIEDELATLIPKLKKKSYTIIGTSVNRGLELSKINSMPKFALIMGNEGHGISSEIERMCNDFVYVPMNEACESLNVSVACSIILYQLDKR